MKAPTVRQLVAYFLLPWAVMVLAGAAGAVVFGVAWAVTFREPLPPPLFVLGALVAGSFVAWFAAAIAWPVWREGLKADEIPTVVAKLDVLELRADDLEISIEQQTRRWARLVADALESPEGAAALRAAGVESKPGPIRWPAEPYETDERPPPTGKCGNILGGALDSVDLPCQLHAGHAGAHQAQSPVDPSEVLTWPAD